MSKSGILFLVVLFLSFLFVWTRCFMPCTKEGYKRSTLSEDGAMKRSPVTTAFQGNGMQGNPHYQADVGDELVPLEYGGVDFYQDERKLMNGETFSELEECYRNVDPENTHLINDHKTRADMVDAGDMGWFRTLTNMASKNHLRSKNAGMVESDFATAGPMDYDQGLYHPSFHNDHIGN